MKEREAFLIRQAQKGHQIAYRQLMELHRDFAFHLSLQLTRNREDAEEVTQDAFVKAFRHLPSFNHQAKFTTWLYRIVYNTALSKLKKKKLEQQPLQDTTEKHLPATPHDSTVDHLKKDEQSFYLDKALSQLKEADRLLITLYYLQEQSVEEVASITGMGKSNVKVRIMRIRQKLQGILSIILKDEAAELL